MPPPPPPPAGAQGSASGWNQPAQTPGAWGVDRPSGPQPAGIGLRIGAYIIDAILVGIVNFVIGLVVAIPFAAGDATSAMPLMNTGGSFLFSFIVGLIGAAITLAYFGLLEGNDGQTLGKKLLNIRAIKADGSGLEISDAVKRRIPFVIGSLIPIPFLGGFIGFAIIIAILVTAASDQPWNRGLHDKWADTMVIRA